MAETNVGASSSRDLKSDESNLTVSINSNTKITTIVTALWPINPRGHMD